jgi:hypothetical protein
MPVHTPFPSPPHCSHTPHPTHTIPSLIIPHPLILAASAAFTHCQLFKLLFQIRYNTFYTGNFAWFSYQKINVHALWTKIQGPAWISVIKSKKQNILFTYIHCSTTHLIQFLKCESLYLSIKLIIHCCLCLINLTRQLKNSNMPAFTVRNWPILIIKTCTVIKNSTFLKHKYNRSFEFSK